ncbi:hypothetical protein SB6421_02871 [Klebsiella huaxiensis]|nr:hypothetical protein SB6421_02871 [Klebsiella huaxiensis]
MKNNTEQPVSTTSHTFRRISVIVAIVLFALATSAFLSRVVLEYSTPRVVAFDMKKTLDSFMDSVSQKQLTEAQSKVNRPGFFGECLVRKLRLPDHYLYW